MAARARLGVVVARIPLPKIADDRNVRRDDGGRTTTEEDDDDDEEADKLLDECCGRTVAWANTETGDDARKSSRMFIMFIFRAGMRRRERTRNNSDAAQQYVPKLNDFIDLFHVRSGKLNEVIDEHYIQNTCYLERTKSYSKWQ